MQKYKTLHAKHPKIKKIVTLCFKNSDDMLDAAESAYKIGDKNIKSDLYRIDNLYYLILYIEKKDIKAAESAAKFAKSVTYSRLTFAKISEYGKGICLSSAIQNIGKSLTRH